MRLLSLLVSFFDDLLDYADATLTQVVLLSHVSSARELEVTVDGQWVATPLAPAVSTMIMAKTGLLHPPACAAAVIFLAGDPLVSFASKVVAGNDFAHQVRNMGWLFIVIPVTFDCVVI